MKNSQIAVIATIGTILVLLYFYFNRASTDFTGGGGSGGLGAGINVGCSTNICAGSPLDM
jgi:hypothetical protein